MPVQSDPVGLVEYVVSNLVSQPEEVDVIPVKGPSSLVIELRVHPDDLGTVIGKGGRIAKSLRNLLGGISARKVQLEDGQVERYSKVILEIVDE